MGNPLAGDLDHILTHTSDLWEKVRGKRLFITGGTGFFGCWLLESFLWANDHLDLGASALVLTRDLGKFRRKARHLVSHPAIQLHAGDVRSFAFPDGEFSYVIHAATETSPRPEIGDYLPLFETILQGTQHTLDFARFCKAKDFLLISSGAVYGRQPHTLAHIPEDYPGGPDPNQIQSTYAEGKRAAELLCALYTGQYALPTKIARCFAFVGPYLPLDIHFAIGNFIRDGLKGGPICVSGDGTPYRSYLYAADLAVWLWTILFRGEACRPYNVGSAEAVRIADLAREVAGAFHPLVRVEIGQAAVPGRPAERYLPDTRRAETELGLRCFFSRQESISRTIHWYQENSKRKDEADDQSI